MLFSSKTGAAGLSVASNVFVITLEVAAALITGSISVLAGAINSFVDLFAAVIAFISLRIAVRPADEEHPFGHGKAENIAGTAEGGLLFVSAGFIMYQAVQKLLHGASIELLELGLGMMVVSIVVNVLVSRHLFRVARATDSIALEADASHLRVDVYTSLGVIAGLIIIRLSRFFGITGLAILDPLVAIGIALLIVRIAFKITRRSFAGLIDTRLPPAEEKKIMESIEEHYSELVGFHALRTRKAGSQRYVDLHLVMSKNANLEEAHRICDHLEEDIENKLNNTSVTIHCEPCESECRRCAVICEERSTGPNLKH